MRGFCVSRVLQIAVVCGLMACDRPDSPSAQQDDFNPALLEQTVPEFSTGDFQEVQNQQKTVRDTVGTLIVDRVDGIVKQILFRPAVLLSPEDFVNQYLPVTADNQVIKEPYLFRERLPICRQYYKGVPVEEGTWFFEYHDGLLDRVYGWFVPIDDLDVAPGVSDDNARKIVENYLKESVVGEDKRFYLSVMSFPVDGQLVPRLVYVYKYDIWENHEYVYVDAKTGRLLYHLRFHGDYPYY